MLLARADAPEPARPNLSPPELYAQACAACHGTDGKGSPNWQGPVPVPDFTDCLATTSEPAEHWEAIVSGGGPARGLSSSMPAFGEALDASGIRELVAYLRRFCKDWEKYPTGDLNFRRPIETGKAFPEQEVVLLPEYARFAGSGITGLEASYENRIGPGFQWEVTVPFVLQSPEHAGLGDVEVELKQVIGFSLAHTQILSGGVELVLPSGNRDLGLGQGTTIVSPFLAFGQAWGDTILQTRVAAEITTNASRVDSLMTFQVALSQALGSPRVGWVPAVEFLGTRDLVTGGNDWSSVLEMSKALSRLGHVVGAVGVRLPITQNPEKYRIEAYLLWDFGDGPFWLGW